MELTQHSLIYHLDNDTNVVGVEEINDQCGLDFGPRVDYPK